MDSFPNRLLDEVSAGGRWWLFLDYDGTLEEFAPTPATVIPNPRLIALLNRLALHPDRLRIVILSGRSLDQVRLLLPVRGILLAGTYGVEYLDPSGQLVETLDRSAMRPALEQLKPAWKALLNGQMGFYLEDKGWALALHAKNASGPEAGAVLEKARAAAVELMARNHAFRLVEGTRFLEVAPVGANKGLAVAAVLERYPWPVADILYFGDDARDEEAFRTVLTRGGRAVLVSPDDRPTLAQARMDSPARVQSWLEDLGERF